VPAFSVLSARLATAQWGLLALALATGAGAGVGAIVFRRLITFFTGLFCGHADYSAAGHAANPHIPWLGRWFVLLVPVVGGLLYGPLVQRFAREARGHGVPEVMYAVALRGGRIAPRVAVVKALASALCMGSGGSVGREGPIVQIGSALGSTVGRALRVPEERMRLLVACGAAGGIAATFNAPLAGVFFAMELILRDFAVESFGAVVVSAVTASVVGRAAFGDAAFMTLPAFHVAHPVAYLLFALLGVVAGAVGASFTRVLYAIEDFCDWLWRGPEWLRPAAGGLLLGALLLVLPQMYGVGYPVLEGAIGGKYTVAFLMVLLLGKMLATSLTIGFGGSGGVFAPSLFLGAMAGTAFGTGVHHLLPADAGQAGAYGLVGMGAAFAGAARAPITAVIVLFELTGEYSIILPMMLAIVFATLTSRLMGRDTVYTLKLRRRGIDLASGARAGTPLTRLRVRDAMTGAPPALAGDLPLDEAGRVLARTGLGVLPVTGDGDRYLGVLSARAVAEASTGEPTGAEGADDAADDPYAGPDGRDRPATAADLAVLPRPVTAEMTLAEALHALDAAEGTGLPVLGGEAAGGAVVGWLTHQAVLAAVARPAGVEGAGAVTG
jgi:CIC family chloride channel protein